MAEDSRVIAVKRQEDEAVNAARLRSLEREANAENGRAAAVSETDRVTREAEAARIKGQADTDRLTREAEAARIKGAGGHRPVNTGEGCAGSRFPGGRR